MVPQCELDVPVGGVLRDVQSQIMTQALRKLQYSLHNSQTLIVLVNQVEVKLRTHLEFFCLLRKQRGELVFTINKFQVRSSSKFRQGIEDMGEDTCGGNALKFYSAVRLRLGKTELIKNEDEVIKSNAFLIYSFYCFPV